MKKTRWWHRFSRHGKVELGGTLRHCWLHDVHGYLYPCNRYSVATHAEILEQESALRARLDDPKWCEEQVRRGLPPEGIAIFRFFAGLDG